ncbi:hypothetical protein ACFWHR_12250 [Leucobacter sp. NPDC058333]|uniref:hypothetical protein n=1 Tax=Leucobacter sp. NPDC058333 TaxID=3346450 RepID=UPI003648787A
MRARALIALEAGAIPTQERHARDLNNFTVTEVVGDEHHEWAAAKASAVIPANALILAWYRE